MKFLAYITFLSTFALLSWPAAAQTPALLRRLPPPSAEQVVGRKIPQETLQSIWRHSLELDDRLASGRWRVSAAASSLGAAAAGRLPTARLNAGYLIRDNQRAFVASTPAPNFLTYQQRENASFGGDIRLPLYTSGRISHQVAAANADLTTRRLWLDEYRLQLKLDVAREYVDVIQAANNLLVAQSSTRTLSSHVHDVEMMTREGKVPRNDLLAAQVAHANGQYQEIRVSHQYDRARSALNRRLKRPLATPISLSPPIVGNLDLELGELTGLAQSRRPELASLSAQMESLRHQAASQKAANRMQIALQGSYAFEENRFQFPQGITAGGIGVTLNAFDRRRDLRADSLHKQAHALASLREDLQSRIELDVRRAWLNVREAHRRKAVTRQAVIRSQENLRVARHQYRQGSVNNTVVLEAEALRVQAEQNDNNASQDAILAILGLQRVVGTL